MSGGLQILTLAGPAAENYLQDLARLRISVFREFPYRYEGDIAYEEKYLGTYFSSPRARVVLCLDQQKVVGASTCIPLQDEDDAFKVPFVQRGLSPQEVMYFGESVLEPQYRGRGLGKTFFEERLKHAHATPGMKREAFCAVVRPEDDPARPLDYRPLDPFWRSYGFAKMPGLECQLSWKEVGATHESPKTLQFWVREL